MHFRFLIDHRDLDFVVILDINNQRENDGSSRWTSMRREEEEEETRRNGVDGTNVPPVQYLDSAELYD